MKPHLRMVYGVENRLNMVLQTLDVCQDYFATIHLTNTGFKENIDQFSGLKLRCGFQIKNDSFWINDFEHIMRGHWSGIPDGEWIFLLDSDERPSQHLLNDLESIIEDCDSMKLNSVRFPSVLHSITNPPSYSDQEFNNVCESHLLSSQYSPLRLVKVNRGMMTILGSYGCHVMIYRKDLNDKYIPHIVHHLKDFHPELGAVLYGFAHPYTHEGFGFEERITSSDEFNRFKAIKYKFRCFTSNDFVYLMKTSPTAKAEFKSMFLAFKNSPYKCFQYMYDFANKWDMKIIENPLSVYCGGACCRYKNAQL